METHLVDRHQLLSSVLLVLVKRRKLDVLRWTGLIAERSADGVEVVGTDSDELAAAADILVELVLKLNKRVIRPRGKLQIP